MRNQIIEEHSQLDPFDEADKYITMPVKMFTFLDYLYGQKIDEIQNQNQGCFVLDWKPKKTVLKTFSTEMSNYTNRNYKSIELRPICQKQNTDDPKCPFQENLTQRDENVLTVQNTIIKKKLKQNTSPYKADWVKKTLKQNYKMSLQKVNAHGKQHWALSKPKIL